MKYLKLVFALILILTLVIGYSDPGAAGAFLRTVGAMVLLPFQIAANVITWMSQH